MFNEKIPHIPENEDLKLKNYKSIMDDYRKKIIKILYKIEDDTEIYKILQKPDEIPTDRKLIINQSINELYADDFYSIINSLNYQDCEDKVIKIKNKKKDNRYTNYFKNFKYFYEKLKIEDQHNYYEYLYKFTKNLIEKCQIIEIRSWQTEQAIILFNSLNSRGMPLNDADIISAKLFAKARNQQETFKERWSEFKDLAEKLEHEDIVNIDSILQQYMYIQRAMDKDSDVTTPGLRRYYTEIKQELLDNPLDLVEKLIKIAKIWLSIKDFSIIKLLLKFNVNIKLFLISYLYRFDVNQIPEEDIKNISILLMRLFSILELEELPYSTSKFKSFLFEENLKLVDKNISFQKIKIDFDDHIKKHWNKDEIIDDLMTYDKNVLVYLNEFLYSSKSKNKPFEVDNNTTIEHIMPRSGRNIDTIRQEGGFNSEEEFNEYVNMLGNKILLESEINKALGPDWFKTKKQNFIKEKKGYKDSKFALASALTQDPRDIWEKDDIKTATKEAAERIAKFIFDEKE